MGCGKSKIETINLDQENGTEGHIEMTKKQGTTNSTENHYHNTEIENSKNISEEGLPNRLLSAIPISDLGESLDSRHLSESFNGGGSKFSKGKIFLPQFFH